MPSKQIREILDDVRAMHRQMSKSLRDIRDTTTDQRLKLLADYMIQHEGNINKCIARYEEDGNSTVLNTWLQFGAEDEMLAQLQQEPFDSSMTPDQLVQAAIDIELDLVRMYQELSGATSVPKIRDMFDNLVELEQSKGRQYARAVQEMMTG